MACSIDFAPADSAMRLFPALAPIAPIAVRLSCTICNICPVCIVYITCKLFAPFANIRFASSHAATTTRDAIIEHI